MKVNMKKGLIYSFVLILLIGGNIDYGFNHNWYKIVPLTPDNYYGHHQVTAML